jgi:hypothetical protein
LRPSGLPPRAGGLAIWLGFGGLPCIVLLTGLRKRRGRVRFGLLLLWALCVVMTWSACGGGSGSGGTGTAGTPAGTYTVTVTGTYGSGSGSLVHSAHLTLVVQ